MMLLMRTARSQLAPLTIVASIMLMTLFLGPVFGPLLGPLEKASATPSDRVEAAQARQKKAIRAKVERAGAAYPPKDIFIRAFKKEEELELWAKAAEGEGLVLIERFPLCKMSGELGPKARQGDKQIPEGFYTIDRLNPRSRFHLSLGLDYPNALDTARAKGEDPGDNIFIHGGCYSVGCLSIGDDAIERVYLIAAQAIALRQEAIAVHLFPCRFGEAACEEAVEALDKKEPALYRALREAYSAFDRDRLPPKFRATPSGYRRE